MASKLDIVNDKRPVRYVTLDGLRGVAAFLVAGLHIYFWQIAILNGINFFVDFFFVLSGFVLAPSLGTGARSKTKFIKSRLIRLYPAVLLSFLIIGLTHLLPFIKATSTAKEFGIHQYVFGIMLLQIFIPSIYWMNIPLWSLSAEIFVNIWAVLMPRKILFIYTYVLLGLCLEILSYSRFTFFWNTTRGYSPIGRVLVGFYLGMIIRRKLQVQQDHSARLESFSRKKFVIINLFLISEFLLLAVSYKFLIFAAPIFYFFIAEVIKIDDNSLPQKVVRVFSYLGKISYGIYVFHGPINSAITGSFLAKYLHFDLNNPFCLIFGFIIKIFVTWCMAALSLKFIEKPLKRVVQRKSS